MTSRPITWRFSRLLASALICAYACVSGAKAEQVLLVQDNSYPPYMTVRGDLPEGIYAAILREAKRRMRSAELFLEAVPWTRATVLVENGRAQGLVGTYYKPDARPWIRHWSVPLYQEEVSVFCRDGVAKADWIYPDDFKGLLFGNIAGYKAPGPRFFEMVSQGLIKLEEAQTNEQNLSKLALGRIDCYVVERLATEILIRKNKFKNVGIVATASMEPAYIGYSDKWTGPEADAFIRSMDQALESMKKDGTIDGIVASFIGGS